jgi:PAS domain S-box-containing protein
MPGLAVVPTGGWHVAPRRSSTDILSGVSEGVEPPLWWVETEGSPISMVWRPDGTVTSASTSCAALFGTTVEGMVGRRWPELIAPGDDEVTAAAFDQLALTVASVDDDMVYAADAFDVHEGRRRVIRWYEWATRNEGGDVVEMRSVAIDVSAMYESRDALAEHMERLAQARSEERQRVAVRLHDGAVQQLVAARWAVMEGEPKTVAALLDEALLAVRSSVVVLDQSDRMTFSSGPDTADDMLDTAAGYGLGRPVDALIVFSAAGTIWESDGCDSVYGQVPRSSIRSLVAAAHPDDRDAVMVAALGALAGDSSRVMWRLRSAGTERLLVSDAHPLPDQDSSRRALLVTRDATGTLDTDVEDELRSSSRAAERARMAQVLHDDVQQRVTALKWLMASRDDAAPWADVELRDAVEHLDTVLRAATSRLVSPAMNLGLATALNAETARMRTPATVRCQANGLSPELSEAVFRCAREALRNIDEHAQATRAAVDVHIDDGQVWVEITDDGVGVSPARLVKAALSGHLGVVSMRESARQLGGHLEMVAGVEGGTVVRFHVPIDAERATAESSPPTISA